MLRFSAHLTVAVLLGMVFYKFGEEASKVQSNVACLFFFLLFLFFANAMPAVQMCKGERSNKYLKFHSLQIKRVKRFFDKCYHLLITSPCAID